MEIINAIPTPEDSHFPQELYARGRARLTGEDLLAFMRAGWRLGIVSKARFCYWKLIVKTFLVTRRALPMAVELAIHGFHFEKVLERVCRNPGTCDG